MNRVSKTYQSTGKQVLKDIYLSFFYGAKIGILGLNGSGKSTLLKIIAGLEKNYQGDVVFAPGYKVGYLEQEPKLDESKTVIDIVREGVAEVVAILDEYNQINDKFGLEEVYSDAGKMDKLMARQAELQDKIDAHNAWELDTKLEIAMDALRTPEPDTPIKVLSGGERRRVALCRLLLQEPDVLLLDEPTNHLDLASVEWLENYLRTWPKAFVVVSHDRYFLDKVANRIWEMSFGVVETYRGNFSHYIQQRAERFERRLKEYETQQAFIVKEEDFIRRNLAGQRTKEAQGRRKRLERLPRLERPRNHKTLSLMLRPPLRSGDLVLATHDVTVGYPDSQPLFTCPDLEIRRGDRIALIGPNGAGKTTFIKTILGHLAPKNGTIRLGAGIETGYFAQTHASLNLEATVLDEILTVENLPIGEARNYLGGFLFSGDDVFKPIKSLSGGERSRVALAKLTLTGANFLILDEPTNHLDIPSQESLEGGLINFGGTILLTSHDRYFIDAVATHVWALEPETGLVRVIKGGYSAYLALRDAQTTKSAEGTNGYSVDLAKTDSQLNREQTKAQKR
ncbi:MAG: ABC-F family ATP-binding cassette domain-containing protein, partial [Flavobacteriaceae bacterium]|nr:ABC-F family ATP-binding cassette domain-containing protein [Flavobacteriaceae bacterium]